MQPEIRPYKDGDEGRVLELLRLSLGEGPVGNRPPEFFRWKHFENPFGRSLMLVAEMNGQIVGLRALMRWVFQAGASSIAAVRAVDTATHPEYQGKGIFSSLTKAAVELVRDEVDLIFNTPNERSMPGYLKMGWQHVANIPIRLRVRHPFRFVRGARSARAHKQPTESPPEAAAKSALQVLDHASLVDLLSVTSSSEPRIRTERTAKYLRWRYGIAPFLDYRAIAEHEDDRLVGLVLFRVRPRGILWETTVTDLIAPPGDVRLASELLRRAVRAADVDHAACSFPGGSGELTAARRSGFFNASQTIALVANQLRPEILPEPRAAASWSLSLGDLELF